MRSLLALASLSGFLAVALGAFGAHTLRRKLEHAPDGARRLEWWQTGASYHLAHALAIGFAGLLAGQLGGMLPSVAAWAFFAGTLLFSGSLYVMCLTGIRALGAVTPLGGLCLLGGWGCAFWAALQG